MKTYLPLFFIITLISTLQLNKYKIDPNSIEENATSLSKIADTIIYIPIDNKIPIGTTYSHILLEKGIYIFAKDIGIIQFNRAGKDPKIIGGIGNGPNEYYNGAPFCLNENSGAIYVLNWTEFKIFSKNGNFLKTISLPKCEDKFCYRGIDFFNSKLIITQYINMGHAKYNWIVIDTLGGLVSTKFNSIPVFSSRDGASGGTYKYNNTICYWNMYNDTIFSILPSFKFEPEFLFAQGEHRLPRHETEKKPTTQIINQLRNSFNPLHIFESKYFLFLNYRFKTKWTFGIVDKRNYKSYSTNLEPGGISGIINDLDGGLNLLPLSIFTENKVEYIIGFIEPFDLKNHVSSEKFIKSVARSSEEKEQLKKLAMNLKETDNKILVMARLKN